MGPQNLLAKHSPTTTTTMAEYEKYGVGRDLQQNCVCFFCRFCMQSIRDSGITEYQAHVCIFRKIHSQRKISTPNFTNLHSQT